MKYLLLPLLIATSLVQASSVTAPKGSGSTTNLVEEINGQIETVSDKIYTLVHYAKYARQITNISIKCTSGTVTADLKINGTNITTCNALAVTTTNQNVTCNTGATNDLAATAALTLVTSSNSACTDLIFTVQTNRD